MDKDKNNIKEESPQITSKELLEGYKQMLSWLFISTASVIVGLGGILLLAHYYLLTHENKPDLPILLFVASAGSLGALLSALMRMYNFKDLPKALFIQDLSEPRKKYLRIYSAVPILVGFTSATVLYLAVAGQIVDGELFADFKCKLENEVCVSFKDFFSYGPEAEID